jgi:hypothetical protein
MGRTDMADDDLPPIPSNFGFKYILWYLWLNSITILMIVQAVFTALTLDPDIVSHNTFHYILIGNAVATAIVAQVKKNNPPSPPPPRSPAVSESENPPPKEPK